MIYRLSMTATNAARLFFAVNRGELDGIAITHAEIMNTGEKVFIGHGRSAQWREVQDFVQNRLNLRWDEFNRESVAGIHTTDRLSRMLDDAAFALLVLTAEDKHVDKSFHARENVIHEVGLFQGRLGLRKAIVLLEDGCEEFSNIAGLGQIRFPANHISSTFEEVRRVLEREGLISPLRS